MKNSNRASTGRGQKKLITEIGIGVGCALGMLALMLSLLYWTPLPGPFLFVPPVVMTVTLFARLPGGLAALSTSLAGIWILMTTYPDRFAIIDASGSIRLIIIGFMSLMLVMLTEAVRRSAQRKTHLAELAISQREMLLRELEHRTRNNLTLIINLLSLQQRQATSPDVAKALDQAAGRVQTVADAYSQLSHLSNEADAVDMALYLERLLSNIASGIFNDRIDVDHDIAEITLPASKAVAVGLYLNEALTNCAKHAFPENRDGKVRILLQLQDKGWRLTIIDDGVGRTLPPADARKKPGGLGSLLFEALASQAGARHQVTLLEPGRRLDLISAG